MKRMIANLFCLSVLLFSLPVPAGEPSLVRMATTTSTDNSGLLKVLLPPFEQSTGYKVLVIAVGTGKALRLGQNGDVDVVVVHAPTAERRFVDAGYGVNRRSFMYNDFIIVGPASDPAGVRGMCRRARQKDRRAETLQLRHRGRRPGHDNLQTGVQPATGTDSWAPDSTDRRPVRK